MKSFALVVSRPQRRRVLINAANLHVGGGVQVAVSFIYELAADPNLIAGLEVTLIVSSEVHRNLQAINVDSSCFFLYEVFDIYGLRALSPSVGKKFVGYDLVFTIFGPLYLSFKLKLHIVGFGQSWILYPNNDATQRLSFLDRIVTRLKFSIQWFFFRHSSVLVGELEHVRRRLVEFKRFPADRVAVVRNCVSPIFFDRDKWIPLNNSFLRASDSFVIGVVSRDYPHKNLDYFLNVLVCLDKRAGGRRFEFVVTLNESEWKRRSVNFRQRIKNVGPLSLAQCPAFYESLDAVLFPSLLESFSATPLEALLMRRPLFASDRAFVRDCCGEHAMYVDPEDPDVAATAILRWLEQDPIDRARWVNSAYEYVVTLPSSNSRAVNYCELIKSSLN